MNILVAFIEQFILFVGIILSCYMQRGAFDKAWDLISSPEGLAFIGFIFVGVGTLGRWYWQIPFFGIWTWLW